MLRQIQRNRVQKFKIVKTHVRHEIHSVSILELNELYAPVWNHKILPTHVHATSPFIMGCIVRPHLLEISLCLSQRKSSREWEGKGASQPPLVLHSRVRKSALLAFLAGVPQSLGSDIPGRGFIIMRVVEQLASLLGARQAYRGLSLATGAGDDRARTLVMRKTAVVPELA